MKYTLAKILKSKGSCFYLNQSRSILTLLLAFFFVIINLNYAFFYVDVDVEEVEAEVERKVNWQRQHPAGPKKNDDRGDVYFMVQFGKAGSSTLRDMFEIRSEWYGNPDMGHPTVNRSLVGRCINPDPKSNLRQDNDLTKKKFTKPGYPFVEFQWHMNPHFWRIEHNVNDKNCTDAIAETAWKLWPNSESADRYRPKPILQSLTLCTPQSKVKCRRLVQLREPVSHIQSSFEYFCKNCKDNRKYCGSLVDAKCGPKHRKIGDHETIQSWAEKFGNSFTRKLNGDEQLLAGGTIQGELSPDGWTHPDALEFPIHVDEVLRSLRNAGDCVVALEDPNRLSKIEACMGDRPGFYTEELALNGHNKTNKSNGAKKKLDPKVTDELRKILATDIYLYESLFPFLATNGAVGINSLE
eukprot:CAMPEP_0194363130 /NCGR_PEP_ID=MMETSP0174-20130528/11036_1 /TAXON_ID=216777 /ORGANISM="Proboscia alata, Strain PI-D3" /LENGTH=410 /DNA_ID=CAMNT_0039136471 /DNA_START=33 /DNA_END=1265 /DNA_ORIENTATION=+